MKGILFFISMSILMTIAIFTINFRNEQIDNGQIKVVSESQMAERN